MMVTPVSCAAIGAVLPFSPLADVLGFTALPISFFLILIGMIAIYLVLVEIAKSRFYAVQAHPRRPPTTHEQRHQRHIARRTVPFTHHAAPAPRHRRRAGSGLPEPRGRSHREVTSRGRR
jgi:Mg2+-importing ATPase